MINYFIPTRLLFGKGAVGKLRKQKLPGKKALIVISSGKSTRANGYLARVEEELQAAGVETVVFDKVLANPVTQNVRDGVAVAKETGCDFVVGLGGGSSIDCAKAIAMMTTNEGEFWDYVYGGTGKGLRMKHPALPIVAIPTTAGTGTEMDPWTVISNEESQEKINGGNNSTFPVLAVVDPDFMLSVPPQFTAFQGFDALFHSTEGYIAKSANEMCDMFALKGIQSVGRHLATAVNDGQNADARAMVALGSTLGGIVMCVGCTTSEHAMEHALSAYHHTLPHGAGLIMLSRAYYTHFIQHAPQLHERFVDMARAMGKTDATDPMDFVTALVDLQKACGVDELKMSDYGITREEFGDFVKNAKSTMGQLFKMDRIELSDEDCMAIYEASYR